MDVPLSEKQSAPPTLKGSRSSCCRPSRWTLCLNVRPWKLSIEKSKQRDKRLPIYLTWSRRHCLSGPEYGHWPQLKTNPSRDLMSIWCIKRLQNKVKYEHVFMSNDFTAELTCASWGIQRLYKMPGKGRIGSNCHLSPQNLVSPGYLCLGLLSWMGPAGTAEVCAGLHP